MENKRDLVAIAIGIALVLAVGTLTVLRNFKESEQKKVVQQEQQTDTTRNTFPTISAKDLLNKISQKKNTIIIDLRDAESFAYSHILDSYNMQGGSLFVPAEKTKEAPVVIIPSDTQGSETANAISFFNQNGFSDVTVLSGGFSNWENASGPTIGYGDPNSIADQAKVSYISTEDAKKEIGSERTVFLDIRDKQSFAENHIEKSLNIPFENLEKRRLEIPQNKKLIICGINELQEFQAAVKINDMFMLSPYVLKGSLTKWKEQGFPMVK